ncbi:MAG: GNAT family N-acetyltransferase [Bacteroidota bacterium]
MMDIGTLNSFIKSKQHKTDATAMLSATQNIIDSQQLNEIANDDWFRFLNLSGHPDFLLELPDFETRNRWAELVFKIIQHTGFSLKDLFDLRVEELGDQVLFQDMSTNPPAFWSYKQINRMVRELASVFHNTVPNDPRVAIYSDNSVISASCDLACLFYDIFDTPVSTHFKTNTIVPIFDSVKINIAVCDTPERLGVLKEVQKKVKQKFKIFVLDSGIHISGDIKFIGNQTTLLDQEEVEKILSKRKRKPINEVATTMFTSGSTGVPKGVSFSIYNLISKRFARHAALPKVGKKEVLLCFLPLFHTFGRYLEMLGTIYWRGTYTFVGNASTDTLLSLFPKINPTAFISVPIRWQQLHDQIHDKLSKQADDKKKGSIIKEIVGNRLYWGLSAAGYLDPKTFSFFQKNNIELCSGFGMTEATGGITMTPPGEYRKNSTGKMLPGIKGKLEETGELLLNGHYLARYLDEKKPGDIIPYPLYEENEYWMPTGDIFVSTDDGFYEIIDRVKDIYKNNKGQTIAPKTIEKKFIGVPGIKQTFLVGDARPYNVLLIVPDFDDLLLQNTETTENKEEYFHQIVMLANKDVPRYERVVNFTLLDRDFSAEKGELTPKGSFNRKVIEKNFKESIEKLYLTNHVRLKLNGLQIIIPRWFYRDLGILENDIIIENNYLKNRQNGYKLHINHLIDKKYQIGDIVYESTISTIDLGRIARQPRLWIGNPEFIIFAPVKEGWDLPLKSLSSNVCRPKSLTKEYKISDLPKLKDISDQHLLFVNNLIISALFYESEAAYNSTVQLGQLFGSYEDRLAKVVRRRLEALSCHPEEKIRVLAYRILLIEDPNPDFNKTFPAFIQSGLSFLTEESINKIALSNFGKQHLASLRKRLYNYRTQLEWPAEDNVKKQFENVLKLLFNFASKNLDYYISIRSELASWILHRIEPELSKLAEKYFFELFEIFDKKVKNETPKFTKYDFEYRIVYETGLPQVEIDKLSQFFANTMFLKESVILAFGEHDFDLSDVPKSGIWVSRLMSFFDYNHYRVSINTIKGKHYDLHMVVSKEMKPEPKYETLYWLAAISGYPYGPKTLPTLGCSMLSLGIRTTKYLGNLTVWDKIREYSEIDNFTTGNVEKNAWKKIFIKAFTIFYRAWHNSGHKVIPGSIGPNNVVVPNMDFRETASIMTLSGIKEFDSTISLVTPMIQNFYCKTWAHYPWVKKQLKIRWIFDAAYEAFKPAKAVAFFQELKRDMEEDPVIYDEDKNLLDDLNMYIGKMSKSYYLPLALLNAVNRYLEWEKITPNAGFNAKKQTIFELIELYKLHKYPDIVRYYLFRKTYFVKSNNNIKEVFDDLLRRMTKNIKVQPMQLIELSDLQSLMTNPDDKSIFSKMVFPKIRKEQKLDIMKIKAAKKEQIIIRSLLSDKEGKTYNFREPLEPSEVAQLYQLFYQVHYPKNISKMDKHFIVTDDNERVIGGLCYKLLEDNVVLLDGSAITTSLQGKGIGSAMVEDFFTRMASKGIKVVKAHFLLGNYYLKHNFKVDKKWGALVRYL